MQTHSEETNTVELLSCNICKKSFRNKYNLKYHKKSHDADVKEKAMALCNQCSKIVTKNKLKKPGRVCAIGRIRVNEMVTIRHGMPAEQINLSMRQSDVHRENA